MNPTRPHCREPIRLGSSIALWASLNSLALSRLATSIPTDTGNTPDSSEGQTWEA